MVDPAGWVEDHVLRAEALFDPLPRILPAHGDAPFHHEIGVLYRARIAGDPDTARQVDHVHTVLAGRRTALTDINRAGEAGLPVVGQVTSQPSSSLVASQSLPLVLPSVPVDQLLDDHAVEFEECKRWANSDAGQAARMTNPAGFANVRAHAEAHLRAMATRSATPQ